jgi:hypothetical protein
LEELSTLIHHKQQDGHQYNVVDNIVVMEIVVDIKLVVMDYVVDRRRTTEEGRAHFSPFLRS